MKAPVSFAALVISTALTCACSSGSGKLLPARASQASNSATATTIAAASTQPTAVAASSASATDSSPSPSSTGASPTGTGPVADAARVTLATAADVTTTIKLKDTSHSTDLPPIVVTGSYDLAKDTGNLDVTLGPRTMTEVLTRDTLYAKSPTFQDLPAGKWVAAPRTGLSAHYLLRTPGNEPGTFIRQVAELTDLETLGSQTVGHATAKHYRGRFNTETLTRYLAQDKVQSAQAVVNLFGPFFGDVWVDGAGRIVRVVVSYTAATVTSSTQLDLVYPATRPAPDIPKAADTVGGSITGGVLPG